MTVYGRSPADQLELLRAPAAVLVHVDAALRVDGDAVGLVELARVGAGAAKIADDLAARALHDLDARVVLVDHEHVALLAVAREVDRHGGAAAVGGPCCHRRRRHVVGARQHAHLVEHADLAIAAVAYIHDAVLGQGHAVHRLVAFRPPPAHETPPRVEHGAP